MRLELHGRHRQRTRQALTACVAIMLATPSVASAMTGRIRGSVDGKAIDVAVRCERAGSAGNTWLQASSDPPMDGQARDRNGDGVAVAVSGVAGRGQYVFMVLVGGETYRFGGRRNIEATASGIRMKALIERYERGSRTPVGSYEVDLSVECPPD